MELNQWVYLGIIAVFGVVFIALIIFYFNKKRYDEVERPKYRMLDDNDNINDDEQ
ncbi:MAG: cbb3-type cytochrome c oxidase subunit 3 [Candidatus Schekmanbacteria bacterium]|nr:cbb3-type cytochrome c oxidase subunit 3 [Candidatus Schekmanbacteria bacterium]